MSDDDDLFAALVRAAAFDFADVAARYRKQMRGDPEAARKWDAEACRRRWCVIDAANQSADMQTEGGVPSVPGHDDTFHMSSPNGFSVLEQSLSQNGNSIFGNIAAPAIEDDS